MSKATDETKALAKEAGIKSWHVKSEEKLQAELVALQAPATSETITVTAEAVEPVIEPKPVIETESKLKLPSGITAEKVWLSIRAMKNKSKLWKYRDLAKVPKDYRGM